MKCIHPTEHLVGTVDGVKCRLCGQLFPTYDELVKDRGTDEKPAEEAKQEEVTEAPKKKTAKKGAK